MRKIFLLCLFMFVNVVYATDVELAWYDGDTTINGPTSCTVGGTFLPPTPPARTGYVFNGWKKIIRKCGIDGLNTSTKGTGKTYRGYTKLNGSDGFKESNYGLTVGSGQWAVEFSYGTVWGMASCNNTYGTYPNVGTPNTSVNGKHCWCQATGFTASGNSYTSGPQCTTSSTSSWVYHYIFDTESTCATTCANRCSEYVYQSSAFRGPVFGAVGQ